MYHSVLRHIQHLFPLAKLRSSIDLQAANTASIPLQMVACFMDYVIVNQQRYHAANRAPTNAGRLVEVIVSPDGSTWAGELLDIISIEQTSDLMYSLGHFRWFRPWRGTLTDTVWNVL